MGSARYSDQAVGRIVRLLQSVQTAHVAGRAGRHKHIARREIARRAMTGIGQTGSSRMGHWTSATCICSFLIIESVVTLAHTIHSDRNNTADVITMVAPALGARACDAALQNGQNISYGLACLAMSAIPLAAPGEKPFWVLRAAAVSGFLIMPTLRSSIHAFTFLPQQLGGCR